MEVERWMEREGEREREMACLCSALLYSALLTSVLHRMARRGLRGRWCGGDLAWCGVVSVETAWYGMVWCCMAWHGMERYGTPDRQRGRV